jgi:predicted nuclease with TOPRIM domain
VEVVASWEYSKNKKRKRLVEEIKERYEEALSRFEWIKENFIEMENQMEKISPTIEDLDKMTSKLKNRIDSLVEEVENDDDGTGLH